MKRHSFVQNLPKALKTICEMFRQHGFACYLVGGAVRDLALGLPPKDFDLATDATPEQIEQLFDHTIPTGKEFGTITVLIESIPYEITTFRKSWQSPNGSRHGQMEFSNSLTDDLAFRDFTINAMAYDLLTGQLIDPFDGREDLKKRLLSSVGRAEERFWEDALRMMRGVRLCAQKELIMTAQLRSQIQQCATWIRKVSPERIADELRKILISKQPDQGVRDLYQLGLLTEILPDDPHHNDNSIDKICYQLAEDRRLELLTSPAKPEQGTKFVTEEGIWIIRLAILLAPLDQSSTNQQAVRSICQRYRLSNAHKKFLLTLLKYRKAPATSDYQLRRLLSELGSQELAHWWVRFKGSSLPPIERADFDLCGLNQHIEQIYATHTPLQVSDLAISGDDLLSELHLTPGPTLGHLLTQLRDAVLREPELNQRERLLELARMIESQ